MQSRHGIAAALVLLLVALNSPLSNSLDGLTTRLGADAWYADEGGAFDTSGWGNTQWDWGASQSTVDTSGGDNYGYGNPQQTEQPTYQAQDTTSGDNYGYGNPNQTESTNDWLRKAEDNNAYNNPDSLTPAFTWNAGDLSTKDTDIGQGMTSGELLTTSGEQQDAHVRSYEAFQSQSDSNALTPGNNTAENDPNSLTPGTPLYTYSATGREAERTLYDQDNPNGVADLRFQSQGPCANYNPVAGFDASCEQFFMQQQNGAPQIDTSIKGGSVKDGQPLYSTGLDANAHVADYYAPRQQYDAHVADYYASQNRGTPLYTEERGEPLYTYEGTERGTPLYSYDYAAARSSQYEWYDAWRPSYFVPAVSSALGYSYAPQQQASRGVSWGFGSGNTQSQTQGYASGYSTPQYVNPAAPNTPQPNCAVQVIPSTIKKGDSITIVWSSQFAETAAITGLGQVEVSGSKSVPNVTKDTQIKMEVRGKGGTSFCYADYEIRDDATLSCSIAASPTSLDYGQSTQLSWSSVGAVSATLLGTAISPQGTIRATPAATKTYTMSVVGAGGQKAECTTTVSVRTTNATSTVNTTYPTCAISLNQTATRGVYVAQWESANATVATLSTIGRVALSGSRTITGINSGTVVQLQVTGNGGTNTCSAVAPATNVATTPTCTLTSTPSNPQVGQYATLIWNTTNALRADLTGSASVPLSGSRVIQVGNTSSAYTLTASNGTAVSQCVTYVTPSTGSTTVVPSPTALPDCDIRSSETQVARGSSAVISWRSLNAYEVTVTPFGSVSKVGFHDVAPTSATTYSMTAKNAAGSRQCSVTVNVTGGIIQTSSGALPTCSITATPSKVVVGKTIKLSWSSSGSTSSSVSGVGSVESTGSRTIKINQGGKYTLTVTNANGSRSCSTTVVAEAPSECLTTALAPTVTVTSNSESAPAATPSKTTLWNRLWGK
jgi:hypothetical protein